MSDSKQHPFAGQFWRNFEQFFGGQLPDLPLDKAQDPEWVRAYVNSVMRQAFTSSGKQGQGQGQGGAFQQTELFETHNSVIVKVYVPDRKTAGELSVYAGIRQIKLDYGANKGEQIVRLVSHVVPESCRAVYKNGILQLHLRKAQISDRMHEVFIRFKD